MPFVQSDYTLHERHAKLIISCMLIVSGNVFAYSMLNIRRRKTGRGVPLPLLWVVSDEIKG